jgi:hypothetical protein
MTTGRPVAFAFQPGQRKVCRVRFRSKAIIETVIVKGPDLVRIVPEPFRGGHVLDPALLPETGHAAICPDTAFRGYSRTGENEDHGLACRLSVAASRIGQDGLAHAFEVAELIEPPALISAPVPAAESRTGLQVVGDPDIFFRSNAVDPGKPGGFRLYAKIILAALLALFGCGSVHYVPGQYFVENP